MPGRSWTPAAGSAATPDRCSFWLCHLKGCLRDAGLDISEEAKSKSDLAKVQAQFKAWAKETSQFVR